MTKKVKIADRLVGDEEPIFIVAEIGINHNGDVNIAKKLIDVAVECGCDAVKFQKKTPEICVPEEQKSQPMETPWGDMTYLEYKKRMEFTESDFREIDRYCKEKGIIWFASCWDEPSVDFMKRFNPPCYKIASASLTDESLLKKVKSTGRPIFLSTGMSTMEEISRAVELLGEQKTILLHCNSAYPAKHEELNLSVIDTLKKKFNCPIGYSGHETGLSPSVAAVVLGACVIERHITLDRTTWGTDHSSSVEPQGLRRLVRDIRVVPIVRGDGVKRVYPSELSVLKKLRRTKFNKKKKPLGTGIDSSLFEKVEQPKTDKQPDFGKIKAIFLDFDGVLTDDSVITFGDGMESVVCSRSDGFGIEMLKKAGIDVFVISRERNPVTAARCKKLNVECVHGVDDKLSILKKEIAKRGLSNEQTAFIGNDISDIECMKDVGLSIAVNDAHASVLEIANYTTSKKGGKGAVREVADIILKDKDCL